MSLVPGDYGSYIRRQQSFGPMGPPMMTQLPTDGSYANRRYQMPFVRQAPMMDMRGIGGLFAGLSVELEAAMAEAIRPKPRNFDRRLGICRRAKPSTSTADV